MISLGKYLVVPASILWLLSGIGLYAEEELIRVNSMVDKSTITIGDRVLYTLEIIHESSIELLPLNLGANLGAFEVKDYKTYPEKKSKRGQIVNKSEYVITTFTTGEYVIPPLEIGYLTADSVEHSIKSEPLTIMVESVVATAEDTTDIRGLKPQASVPAGYLPYIIIAAVLLLLGGGIWYWRYRKLHPKPKEEEAEPPIPPWEEALLALSELESSDLLATGQVKFYYLRLSEIVKRYLERRFPIAAVDMTTYEIKQNMRKARFESWLYERSRDFLESADLVKFAKYIPSSEEIENDFASARYIVEETIPTVAVEEAAVRVEETETTAL
ncbi:MAG: hypothetical protein AMJ41_03050 [candidate division Zixibacteria bacterium DG_27]|nr:MAG: hypothetical protein AMJ41_03050 [candidate division Zixibacteria bacterium DG_27]